MMLASIAEPMEQREPTCLHDWPSRERGRRSPCERFRAKLKYPPRHREMGSANCIYPFGLRNMKCPVGQISNKSEKSDKKKLKDLNKFERFDFPFGRRAKPSASSEALKEILHSSLFTLHSTESPEGLFR